MSGKQGEWCMIGEYDWYVSEDGIAVYKWKDRRMVRVTSSYHCPTAVVQVSRKERDGSTSQMNCPEAIKDYNMHMNCVDKFDQLKALYEIDRKSHKWWHRIFFYFLDAAVVNSFIISKDILPEKINMKTFRLEIVDGLFSATYVKKHSEKGPSFKIKKHKPQVPLEIRKRDSSHQPRRTTITTIRDQTKEIH